MKPTNQEKKMKEIYDLILQDLTYIYGEKESGPNGAKKIFLRRSADFLKQLGKDLGFSEVRVNTNSAGIGSSGEVTLYGIWGDGNGLFFEITQPLCFNNNLLFREITGMKDTTGKCNQWLSTMIFRNMEYERLCSIFNKLHSKVTDYAA